MMFSLRSVFVPLESTEGEKPHLLWNTPSWTRRQRVHLIYKLWFKVEIYVFEPQRYTTNKVQGSFIYHFTTTGLQNKHLNRDICTFHPIDFQNRLITLVLMHYRLLSLSGSVCRRLQCARSTGSTPHKILNLWSNLSTRCHLILHLIYWMSSGAYPSLLYVKY